MTPPSMLETRGRVVAADSQIVIVEATPRAACAGCANVCGIGRVSDRRRMSSHLQLPNRLGLTVGDEVVLGISEQQAIGAALRGYGLPLLATILAMAAALAAGIAPVWHPIAALIGLLTGLAFGARRESRVQPRSPSNAEHAPYISSVRRVDESNQGVRA